MSHTEVGSSSVALVTAELPPPYGKMSYATTGTDVVMWNASPRPVPCTAASAVLYAAVTPDGHGMLRMPG